MDDLTVLVVAPYVADQPEEASAEAAAVVNDLSAHLMQGKGVTAAALQAELSRREYDLLWLITHGGPDGVLLSDGWMNASELAQGLRAGSCDAVYINTCESMALGLDIHESTGAAIILTVGQISDRSAYLTGSTLARQLSKSGSLREAYELSRPDSGDYRFIAGKQRHASDRLDLVIKMLDQQGQRVELIERRISVFERRLTLYAYQPGSRKGLPLALGMLLGLIVMSLAYQDVRQLIGVPWPVSLALVAILMPLAVWLSFYGAGVRGVQIVDH